MKPRGKDKKGGPRQVAQRPASGVSGGPKAPKPRPAELDQDAGGGYNPDGTYPQQ
jgi:hypothetical protein